MGCMHAGRERDFAEQLYLKNLDLEKHVKFKQ